ncbi:mannose-1-phosphate guanylyltransferase [Rubricoccus marinus]|uniref:mannose-1-phosphate guanylyltransferase n=1 Tax=Rubricoccus marinus TaxID=716817 RepID=A0A259TW71_9BACT|nr:mannose-1-phosphate guanylyltransferase [Rubricoccus marinus]OZC01946.1 mannose-1-phosphate guanylyltransferase [Rubricoccus marinus]
MSLYAVIMAGGVGSRFWPRSRRATPKQFLDVLGPTSLIQNTAARLQGLVEPERIFVVTHADYVEQTQEHLPFVPAENILAEPIAKNTAPCIAFAAARLHGLDPDATMLILPADHLVQNVKRFQEVVREAVRRAETPEADGASGAFPLVTIGVRPTHPETGYGYIQYDADGETDGVSDDGPAATPEAHRVMTFAEKPDLATAERFVEAGDFLWNSGMFIWRADAILAEMEEHLPEIHALFAPLASSPAQEAITRAYERTPKVSIDVGIMEKARHVWVVPGAFGWSDVGDWRAVHAVAEKDEAGNVAEGDVIFHHTSRSYAKAGPGRMLVLVGLQDAVVVDAEDAVLVCHRESAQRVKDVVDYLGVHGLDHLT